MMSNKFNVVSIGPFSYVGGINVHIARLSSLLDDSADFDFVDDAPPQLAKDSSRSVRRPSSVPRILKRIWQSDIVHVHSRNWLLRILFVLISRLLGSKVVVTLHSYRLSGLKKAFSDFVMRLANEVICVNPDIKSSVGIGRAFVKEAFVPPVNEKMTDLPAEVESFVHEHSNSVLLCANAYRMTWHEGKDLYGLDQCLAVARKAKAEGDEIAIIFVVGTVMMSDDLYHSAQQTVADEGLEAYIKIYPQSLDFLSLIDRSDIVLRPTVTDGDALTIREALFFGKPVIASDVVARPAGTITYRSEDTDDLYGAIKKVASATPLAQGKSGTAPIEEYQKFYLEVYKKCIS